MRKKRSTLNERDRLSHVEMLGHVEMSSSRGAPRGSGPDSYTGPLKSPVEQIATGGRTVSARPIGGARKGGGSVWLLCGHPTSRERSRLSSGG